MKIRIFGESHSEEIGVEIAGVPAGTAIDMEVLQCFLDRRAPGNGQGGMSTPRKEKDKPIFESGVDNGIADGDNIRAIIRNTNIRKADYQNTTTVPRPGHADYASWLKYGKIPTGGGKWSGRMTAPLCIAGGIALQMLAKRKVTIESSVMLPFNGGENAEIAAGDSIGGIVEVTAKGFPAGIGDVGVDGLESKLASAFFGIPAVKGVEFGDGFKLAAMRGSEANDAFAIVDGKVALKTNHCGGILGGVSIGMPIVARLAFKPTPSISIEQDSVDLETLKPTKLMVHGRHDRCVAFRGAVAAEAAMAIVLETELFG